MADEKTDASPQGHREENELPKISSIAEAISVVKFLDQNLFEKNEDIRNFLDTKHTLLEVTKQHDILREQAKKIQAFRSAVYDLRNKDITCNDMVWCMLCAKGDRLVEKTDELDSLLRKDKNDLKKMATLDVIQLFTLAFLFPFAAYSLLKAAMPTDSKIPLVIPVAVAATGVVIHYRKGVINALEGVGKEITIRKGNLVRRTTAFIRKLNTGNNDPK
jgi:hypothetical protein